MNAIRNLAQGSLRRGLVSVSHPPAMGLVQTRLQQQQQNNNNIIIQTRFISKYISKSMKKRIPLTTKRAGKGYYKGNGATKEGRLTSKGRFIPNRLKMLELVVPDLEGFNVSAVYSTVSYFGWTEKRNEIFCCRQNEGSVRIYLHYHLTQLLRFSRLCAFLDNTTAQAVHCTCGIENRTGIAAAARTGMRDLIWTERTNLDRDSIRNGGTITPTAGEQTHQQDRIQTNRIKKLSMQWCRNGSKRNIFHSYNEKATPTSMEMIMPITGTICKNNNCKPWSYEWMNKNHFYTFFQNNYGWRIGRKIMVVARFIARFSFLQSFLTVERLRQSTRMIYSFETAMRFVVHGTDEGCSFQWSGFVFV